MASITTWIRLEPGCRNVDMSTGLQARIYDPLWLLARQWQIGEFQGEDNGSPTIARLQVEAAELTRFHPGATPSDTMIDGLPYDGKHLPLETRVEREHVRPQDSLPATKPEKLRLAVDAGLHFLRVLDQQPTSKSYRDAFTHKYGLPLLTAADQSNLDGDSLSFLQLAVGRVPDGRLLFEVLKPGPNGELAFPSDLGIARGDVAEVERAVRLWRQWYATLFSEPEANEACWIPERMEYAFSVAARMSEGEVPLTAQEYFEGALDWHDFDVNFNVSLGARSDNAISQISHAVIPAPVSFRGAPARRLWEFEDARVDFGAINAGPEDLARMLLVEFAISYGNDWFVIPVELPVGSLCRTQSLTITNSFGEHFLIRSSKDAGEQYAAWRMFELSFQQQPGEARTVSDLFFLPPSLMKSNDSPPIEEVLFLRDEMANLAWGVERVIESATESPLRTFAQPSNGAPVAVVQSPELVYKLATEVPDNWVPLLPVRNDSVLRLQRGKVLKLDGTWQFAEAEGRILNHDSPNPNGLSIFEEEIPREGIRVRRHYQLARWHDGSTHLWIGRRKQIGRGEGSSGLRFDTLER